MKNFLEDYGEFIIIFLFAIPIIVGFVAFCKYALGYI